MDTNKLKASLAKLSIIKDYSSLVIPVIILFLAILIFVPAKLMGSKLEEKIQKESITQIGRQIDSFLQDAVSKNQWKVEQAYQDRYAKDANDVLNLAKQSGQRELLSYIVFPEPAYQSQVVITEFGENFRNGIEKMIKQAGGGEAPADAEMTLLVDKFTKTEVKNKHSRNLESQIKEAYCSEKAKSLKFYVNPEMFSGYVAWKEYQFSGMTNGVRDCWYWQLGYWVIDDVVNTIKNVNNDAPNVIFAPVKRVDWVGFTRATFGGKSKEMSFDDNAPRYLLTAEDALTAALTGRVSSSDFNILHFQMVVLVDSRGVNSFLKELCKAKKHKFYGWDGKGEEKTFEHNAISVLDYNMSTINAKEPEHQNCRYGDASVVRLDLICEYLFYKDGYVDIMPKVVKEVLGVEDVKSKSRR